VLRLPVRKPRSPEAKDSARGLSQRHWPTASRFRLALAYHQHAPLKVHVLPSEFSHFRVAQPGVEPEDGNRVDRAPMALVPAHIRSRLHKRGFFVAAQSPARLFVFVKVLYVAPNLSPHPAIAQD